MRPCMVSLRSCGISMASIFLSSIPELSAVWPIPGTKFSSMRYLHPALDMTGHQADRDPDQADAMHPRLQHGPCSMLGIQNSSPQYGAHRVPDPNSALAAADSTPWVTHLRQEAVCSASEPTVFWLLQHSPVSFNPHCTLLPCHAHDIYA